MLGWTGHLLGVSGKMNQLPSNCSKESMLPNVGILLCKYLHKAFWSNSCPDLTGVVKGMDIDTEPKKGVVVSCWATKKIDLIFMHNVKAWTHAQFPTSTSLSVSKTSLILAIVSFKALFLAFASFSYTASSKS